MKKIICPNCGEVEYYGIVFTRTSYALYDANDEPCGDTEPRELYYGKIKRCLICNKKVNIVEE